jgi:pimeloyl-ACP methyl ester carboxylesterase
MLRHLTDRFTCYLPSIRGVGLSGDNPDHSPPGLEDDVNSFVDSIGEPACLVGFSTSGPLVLGTAIHSGAVAVYDLLVGSACEKNISPGLGAMRSGWARRLPRVGSSTRPRATTTQPPTTSSRPRLGASR